MSRVRPPASGCGTPAPSIRCEGAVAHTPAVHLLLARMLYGLRRRGGRLNRPMPPALWTFHGSHTDCPHRVSSPGSLDDCGVGACSECIRNVRAPRDLQRKSAAAPGLHTACQRAHPGDALAPQEQRHPGAAGLVGSGAVEHDFPIARNLLVPLFDFCRGHVDRPRQLHLTLSEL